MWGQPLKPIMRTAPRVQASISARAKGTVINLVLSGTFIKDHDGYPTDVEIIPGSGDHTGKLMLNFKEGGDFKLRIMPSGGGARLQLPVFDGVPSNYNIPAIPCVIVTDAKHLQQLVIELPMTQWREAVQQAEMSGGGGSGAGPGVVEATGAGLTPLPEEALTEGPQLNKINATNYLRIKGYKVSVTAGEYVVNGQKTSRAAVVARINKHREESHLDPVTAADVIW